MRFVFAVLTLSCAVATGGTRALDGGASCSACTFALCVGASGYYERCVNPCDAEVSVRVYIDSQVTPRSFVARGKKRTRLTCHGFGAPCTLCVSDADCIDTRDPSTRGICVEQTCKYVCPSGVVLEYP